MTTTTHDELRILLGGYALGTLEPADQHRVEAHLARCTDCLTELAELDAVVPALASVTPDDLAAPAPSADLFARIRGAVDATEGGAADDDDAADDAASDAAAPVVRLRDRRPRRWVLAVAASVVLLAGAGTAAGIVEATSSHSSSSVFSASSDGVSLRVDASDQGSGTRLELTAKGLPAHEHCRLVAVADDGARHDAGSWNATYDGEATLVESTDVPLDRLRSLTLYGTTGQQLVVVNT